MSSTALLVFWRQFWALFRKNWIVLSRHKLLNVIRCLILPFAYGIFLAVAQVFLLKPDKFGLGTPRPILSLPSVYDPTLALIWADATNGTTNPSPAAVMALLTQSLDPSHRASVRQVPTTADIPTACPQNFNGFSECFAAIAFDSFPAPSTSLKVNATLLSNTTANSTSPTLPPINPNANFSSLPPAIVDPPNGTSILPPGALLNYTIHADAGLGFIDVVGHTSDFEKRIMPVQWAVDQAIIKLQTGTNTPLPTPLEWPYSIETDEEQSTRIRLSYIRGLRTLLSLALFLNFLGVSYHLPGSYGTEKMTGLEELMRGMGVGRVVGIVAHHISISLAYLPAWILTALLWKFRIFSGSSVVIIIFLNLLTGLSLASTSLLPPLFPLPPSLSAALSTFLSIIWAVIALVYGGTGMATTGGACGLVLVGGGGAFWVLAVRAIAGFEVHHIPTSIIHADPDSGLTLLPIMICAVINIFLYPAILILLERYFYDAHDPRSSKSSSKPINAAPAPASNLNTPSPNVIDTPDSEPPAIVVRHLRKTFHTSYFPAWLRFRRSSSSGADANTPAQDPNVVTAISDLSLTIPRGGIYVLLGSNGAGKSTALSILGGMMGRTGGSVVFPPLPHGDASPSTRPHLTERGITGTVEKAERGEDTWTGPSRPLPGTLGIVPQKNVLFPELTCMQTVRVWRDLKAGRERGRGGERGGISRRGSGDNEGRWEESDQELERLLVDCGLEGKADARAGTLSGGQKRKLQLAVGLVGGSEVVLVDECTSGVDPLSRRSIWRTLTAVKNDRTVVFTTHFLDEADLLADHIAILAAPGKLVAEGSPVILKSRLGKGYTLNISFDGKKELNRVDSDSDSGSILGKIKQVAPRAAIASSSSHGAAYALNEKDAVVVRRVLEVVQDEKARGGLSGYEVHGTSIEDIFLELMAEQDVGVEHQDGGEKTDSRGTSTPVNESASVSDKLQLTSGRKRSPLAQSFTIFYKRCLIARRSWLSSILAILVAVAGACIPLFFMSGRTETCRTTFENTTFVPLFLGNSPYSSVFSLAQPGGSALVSPPGVLGVLGPSIAGVPVTNIPDNGTFVKTVQHNFQNLSLGGLSMDLETGQTLFAWEGTPPGLTGPTLLNLASNLLYNRALNASGRAGEGLILATYASFPAIDAGTLVALKWVAFFGATMGAFPAFFAMYVALERRSSVQAMQLSNGLTNPAGLWLGHLMFDGMVSTFLATIITIVFAAASNQFHGLGYFWLVLVLYGFAASLFAYCVSLVTASPLAAFAAVAGYQVIMFIVYLAGYLLTITYAKNSKAANIITIIHFTVSVASPVASVMRAALVSVNLFSLLCNNSVLVASSLGNFKKFGGPITYLIVECLVFFAVLVYVDSGSLLPRWLQFTRPPTRATNHTKEERSLGHDVVEETEAVETSTTDLLRVLHVSKAFHGAPSKAVDDVSFGVSQDTVFAMLGPNGAGKTSTFNIIRGDIYPDSGDVYINGTSIIAHPNTARLSLGVCPQFTAIDPQLTVRQHLIIYGLLKGLRKGPELDQNVESLLRATTLSQYADRLANKLSGGNQRKLSFAIALMGNPSVILIDEYSTGIDAATKRSMWVTFRRMAVGKAVVITTHSMEEASALANKVGILAGRMLAIGTTETLAARYALYEVHFPARTRAEIVKAQELMARIPGSRMADDVATRFEVPIRTEDSTAEGGNTASASNLSLAQLFDTLSAQNDFPEYTVERISLESVFLKVIREHNIQEESTIAQMRRRSKRNIWRCC